MLGRGLSPVGEPACAGSNTRWRGIPFSRVPRPGAHFDTTVGGFRSRASIPTVQCMPTLPYGDTTMPRTTAHGQRGLTLIEAATVTGIVAVLVGVTLPSFHELVQRRQVEGVAAQLETDLHLARSEAVARNRSVRVSINSGDHGSCYVLHTGPAGGCVCDGGGGVVCAPEASAMRSAHQPADAGVRLQSNVGALLFDATKGTVSPTGTLRVQGGAGHLHLVVNIMGRARACTPDGRIAGYRAC